MSSGQKFEVRRLPISAPPLPESGGRLITTTGELTPFANGGYYRFAAYLEFLPDRHARRRGNHYHAEKTETLYIVKGALIATYVDLDSGERTETHLQEGDLAIVYPRCAHAYTPLEYSQAVELASHSYDATDTVPYRILN
jgi:hypothetical protein